MSKIYDDIKRFYYEDGLDKHLFYFKSLPFEPVNCSLNFKSDLLIAGLPYFFACFNFLGAEKGLFEDLDIYEGKEVIKEDSFKIEFTLPFSIAVTGERVALNLLRHASTVATITKSFVKKASEYNIKILDTRKTTPGLRFLEKYAVRLAGGFNHRWDQTDVWMVKDNHKNFFGGIEKAVSFFRKQQGFYTPIEVEIHSIDELKEALDLDINYIMLDNFTPEEIKNAVKYKKKTTFYEVSGGINIFNIEDYLIEGVDAISSGALTSSGDEVDISLKYGRCNR